MKKISYLLIGFLTIISCVIEPKFERQETTHVVKKTNKAFGFNLDDFVVTRDTVKYGDTFGAILDAHHVTQKNIFNIVSSIKDSFDVRKLRVGRPYLILAAKDSVNTPQVFIYEKNRIDYTVVHLQDSIKVNNKKKPVTIVEKTASGVITSSLSQTMDEQGLPLNLTDRLALIYAWTIDFFRLQKGDRFKVIYTQKFINDTIPAGIDQVKAAYFEHRGKPIYAFRFIEDSTKNTADFYDENANNLRRAFLKAPVKFSRISSRFNLRRRIKYYGYKIRPHKGTDFAAPIGTPILATADGVVTKSERKGGNGNYVKIRHNATYSTQYLHMKKRNVKVGDFVRQGDVIGWIGMTGNTGGPHVCYRFWKDKKQVDPLKLDLPASKPLPDTLKDRFSLFISPLKKQLDSISFDN